MSEAKRATRAKRGQQRCAPTVRPAKRPRTTNGDKKRDRTDRGSQRDPLTILNNGCEQLILAEVCPELPYEIIDVIIDFELYDPKPMINRIEPDDYDVLTDELKLIAEEKDDRRLIQRRVDLVSAYIAWQDDLDDSVLQENYGRGMAHISLHLDTEGHAAKVAIFNLSPAAVAAQLPLWARGFVKLAGDCYSVIVQIYYPDSPVIIVWYKWSSIKRWKRISTGARNFKEVVERARNDVDRV